VSRSAQAPSARERIAQAFTAVEDVLYVGLGVVLAAGGVALLVNAAIYFARRLVGSSIGASVVGVLDQLLLMMIEILYTVQVSFREHVLVPEPFVLVALIAAVRRILVITAEFRTLADQGSPRSATRDRARVAHRDDRGARDVPGEPAVAERA
jgi:phosphate-starvation-inducible protein E